MRFIKIIFPLLLLTFCLSPNLFAQDAKLAQQYYQDGEFEKAAVLFEKLYRANESNSYYFNRQIDCLISLEEYDACEMPSRKKLKRSQRM